VPRYFFNVHDGRDIPDQEGTELSGPREARDKAVIASGEALKDLNGAFWDSEQWTMVVTDESGATVCELKFSGKT
jgi:precorrin-6x reductase